jgi:hypothetical protein
MSRERKLFAGMFSCALLLTSASAIFGQQKQPAPDRPVMIQTGRPGQEPDGPINNTFVFVASEMGFDGKLVKGSPYSAQAITETTQTLADGNRIVNKTTASVYRDSEGRTRREQTVGPIGALGMSNQLPQTIFISDPVAGVSYVLEPNSHIARKMNPMRFEYKIAPPAADKLIGPPDGPPPGEGAPPPERIELRSVFTREAPPGAPGAGVVMTWQSERDGNVKTESLGKQTIEGVEAEGTRVTATIPAGEIGNERAIEEVSERWYSPELQAVVMTKHSDPRFGETVYRLTNINRSEPAKSLFEVPSDYTIKEGPQAPQSMRMRRPMDEQ